MKIQNLLLCTVLTLSQFLTAQTFELHNSINFSDLNDGRNVADGITWFKSDPIVYGIYRTSGSWTPPNYQQLKLSFDTGIIIDGGYLYGKSGIILQPNGGNVGIGTSTPISKLDVIGKTNISGLGNSSPVLGSLIGGFNISAGYSSTSYGIQSGFYNNGAYWIQSQTNDGSTTAYDILLNPLGGNICIGTNNSIFKLQVEGGIGNGILYSANNTIKNVLGASATEAQVGSVSIHPLSFLIGSVEKARIDTNGNVGIGTTNPTAKLTVAGNIASREVKVTVDAGADFVFDENYKLPSLESLDKYVKENKHLPEIASASDMQKEGINLSEMNIKLLQKIEELTLYSIEQNKKIIELERQNKKLSDIEKRLEKIEAHSK